MTPEQFDRWLQVQERQAISLEQIALLLEQNLPRQPAPNFKALLEEFDDAMPKASDLCKAKALGAYAPAWQDINAKVESIDKYGAATVIWNGERYKRRSPQNKYGAVIFYSRCVGKSDDGANKYERRSAYAQIVVLRRLAGDSPRTFEPLKDLHVEPISNQVEEILG